MRNLVVCCDGSWATMDLQQNGILCPTNVARLYHAVDDSKKEEVLKYYHPGVGTEGGWWARLRGGVVGAGLDKNIMSAYNWLAEHYKPQDNIFIFGFSRGAYTARSLAGMVSICGLIDFSAIEDDIDERWKAVESVFRSYRQGKPSTQYPFIPGVRIHFLGVWDTVGALGIPDNYVILSLLFNRAKRYRFHNTNLSTIIDHARHAVALDEKRASFTSTLWTPLIPLGCDVKQTWFPGGHGDVGGGCLERGLSDGALLWMIKEAEQLKLPFKEDMKKQITPDPKGASHDAVTGISGMIMRTQPRSCPYIVEDPKQSDLLNLIDNSVVDRQKNPPITLGKYFSSNILAVGGKEKVVVYVGRHWAETGIYLEKGGIYNFTAQGQWIIGGKIKCTADSNKVVFTRFIFGELLGIIERLFKLVFWDKEWDFFLTKRVENVPWLKLTGVVANAHEPNPNGTPASPEIFAIGKEHMKYQCKESGYLYCFINDAWDFYNTHQGSLKLTVSRV
ncbi:MAG: DUF2235 domain-containing protein [Candidatus Omnitrophota bacterium]